MANEGCDNDTNLENQKKEMLDQGLICYLKRF